MRVVTNTSPLIALFQIGQLDLLERLYGRLVVPQAVVDELTAGRHEGYEVPDCGAYGWMVVETIAVPSMLRLITALGPGEAEALALSLATPTDLVLLDDGLARQLAKSQALRVTGTLGLLVEAKRAGLIPLVMPHVARLRAAGFRMGAPLAAAIARLAGE